MGRTYNGRFYLPDEPKVGAGWLIAGLLLIPSWPSLITLAASIGCFVKYGKQVKERNLYRRFHEYCAVIGRRGRVSLRSLRKVSPSGTGITGVRRDVQQMIARGYFGSEAYIDLDSDELVLPDAAGAEGSQRESAWDRAEREGMRSSLDALWEMLSALGKGNQFQHQVRKEDEAAWAEPETVSEPTDFRTKRKLSAARRAEPAPKPAQSAKSAEEPAKRTYAEELERTLNELYQLNEGIEDAAVSDRIDRIGTLTAGIFRAVIERPEREQDVRKFMNYYLPTTLKLLRSYDMLEGQRVQSQNITDSRRKIEEVLDMLIQAYERQLDRLYRDDALDIAAEVDVLESMMAGDGLSSKMEFPSH